MVRLLPLPPELVGPELRAHAAAQPGGAVLDSGPDGWQFLAWAPRWTLTTRGTQATLEVDGAGTQRTGAPLELLRELLAAWHLEAPPQAPPFWGGAIGYLAYDLGRQLERWPELAIDDLALPDMVWHWYDHVIARAPGGEAWLCAAPAPGDTARSHAARTAARLAELQANHATDLAPLRATGAPRPNLSRSEYRAAHQQLQEHIRAGDLYQANLSQRFTIPVAGDPRAWFELLCRRNPAPFAALLHEPEHWIVSTSPERFLEKRADRLLTCPIKGTRPRGSHAREDERLAAELVASAKDRAEHLMIVDLERNDLGRVCVPGTVRVPVPFALEAHPTVWHLVSSVTGQLRPDADVAELLAATFPGGSITGAPKIRAMAVLEGLEPTRRGIYTGALGYLGRDGDLDLNIAIRTAVVRGERAYVQVGGGIVADSDPEAEYQETLDKAAALFDTLGVAACPC